MVPAKHSEMILYTRIPPSLHPSLIAFSFLSYFSLIQTTPFLLWQLSHVVMAVWLWVFYNVTLAHGTVSIYMSCSESWLWALVLSMSEFILHSSCHGCPLFSQAWGTIWCAYEVSIVPPCFSTECGKAFILLCFPPHTPSWPAHQQSCLI